MLTEQEKKLLHQALVVLHTETYHRLEDCEIDDDQFDEQSKSIIDLAKKLGLDFPAHTCG